MNEALRQPEVQDHLEEAIRRDFRGLGREDVSYMGEEVERWRAVIKAANIEIQ